MTSSRLDMNGSPPSLWRRRLTVALILFAIVSFNILNILLTVRLTFCHNRQLQAINNINITVSAAHFSCDKLFSGDHTVPPREVDALLRQARTEAGVMLALSGANTLHRFFHTPEFKGSLDNLVKQLDAVTLSTQDRLLALAAGKAPLDSAEVIARDFSQANQVIGKADALLWQVIHSEQGFFLKVQILLAILSVNLALLTIYFLYRYDRIRKRSLEARADQRNQEQFLAQFSRFCRDTAAIEPVYEMVTSWLSGHLGIARVSVWRFAEGGATLSCRCLHDSETGQFLSNGGNLSCAEIPHYSAALKRDEPIVAEEAQQHPATAELTERYLLPHDIRSILDLPLKLNGEIAGVLCLEARETRRWEPREIALCLGVAAQVSMAMDRTWERESLEKEQAVYAARLEGEVKDRATALAAATESLQKNESRLQLIFNKAPFGAALVDLYGHFLQINEEFCRFTGYAEAELAAVNYLRLVHAESTADYEENFSRLLAGEISKFRADNLYLQKEGGSIWGRTTIRLLRDDSGNALYFLVLVENISERKHYEDRLDKLHKAIEQSPLSIVITDSSGNIEYANPFFCSLTGYELTEVVGKNPRVLKSDMHDQAFYQDLWQTITAGKTWQSEICSRKKDGALFWEHALIAPVTDKNGKIASFIAVKEDISARKQLADELRERSEMITSIATAALSAIIMIDNRGLISFWNKAAEEIFGWTREEVLGRDLHRIVVREEFRQQFLANFDHFRQSGTGAAIGRQVELTGIRKNGEEFPVEISLSAARIKGEWHAVGIVNDISERKTAQESILIAKDEAEAANRAKSDFLARMSHEIRTPMNAIIGLSDLALEMESSPKLQDYLGKIASSGKNLLCIINDILDFSKIEAKKLRIEPHPFSLEKILADLASVTTIKAAEKGLEFMFSVAPDVPDRLVGDSVRLGQVLINLTSNAIKFTSTGEVILDIALQEQGGESLTLRFSVRDTGLGLTGEQIENLFTPFNQADGSISRNYGGTGLGLAISKRLVDLMGGDIEVQSHPGQGSIFSFTAVLIAQTRLPEPVHSKVDLRGLRVLVVEDHPATREILHKALESFSCLVTAVDSGEKGIEAFQGAANTEHSFDLLLLDYRLSGISGDIVARAVREMQPRDGQPKILLLTSVGAWKIVERCLEAGCDSVMDKPVSRSGLFDAITSLFDKDHSACDALPEKNALHRRIAGARVLVVEDNEINQQVAAEILQRAGVLVDLAENGEEAVEAVLNTEYDLVLMDIQMPGMDGLEATRVIRASGIQHLTALPIVAMTANAIKGDEALSLAAGMNDHITKPIDPKVLFAVLGKWLPQNAQPAAAATAQETSPVGPEDLPQRIPGIDLELALKRLGSTELCKAVLRQFVEHYTGGADSILAQIRNRQWDEACKALHSLKGVAGAICAQELYAVTVDLEKTCKEEQAPLELLAAFKKGHDTLIENLQPFRAPASAPTLSVQPPGQGPESLRLRKMLVSMLPDIEAHRPVKCGAHLAELKKITWPAERQVEMETLITAVENYQFKQAGQLAEQLIKLFDPEDKQ